MFLHLLIPILATAWNGEGHRIIVKIAHALIDDRAKGFLTWIFHGTDQLESYLISKATWADTVAISDPRFAYTSIFHFASTTETCEPFEMERDCDSKGCLV